MKEFENHTTQSHECGYPSLQPLLFEETFRLNEFDFGQPVGDARVAELKLLSFAAHNNSQLAFNGIKDGPWQDLIVSLVWRDLFTAFSYDWAREWMSRDENHTVDLTVSSGIPGESFLEKAISHARVNSVNDVYKSGKAELKLTHEGRIRISELQQALRSGREREPFGILWDIRHWEQDLQIAILDADQKSPVGIAYIDMNGLKQINDGYGHDAGDKAIKTYFRAIQSSLPDGGQAYRLGGDEVLAICPAHNKDQTIKIFKHACQKLSAEQFDLPETRLTLTMAVGITICDNPLDLPENVRSRADEIQGQAKEASKRTASRQSAIATGANDEIVIVQP